MTFRLMVVHHNTRLGYKRWQTNTQPSGNKYVLRALHPSPPKTPQCFPYFSKIRHHTQRKKRPRVGRWSWAAKVGLLLLRVVQVVRQQQRNGHCLFDSAQAQQLKQQLRSAQVAGQWRGDTALTLPLFWRRSTVSPVFFGRFPRSSLHSLVPFPLCPRP